MGYSQWGRRARHQSETEHICLSLKQGNTQGGGVKGSRGRGHAAEAPLGWSGECRADLGGRGGWWDAGARDAGVGVEDSQGSVFLWQLIAGGSRATSLAGFSPKRSLADPDPATLPYLGPLLF